MNLQHLVLLKDFLSVNSAWTIVKHTVVAGIFIISVMDDNLGIHENCKSFHNFEKDAAKTWWPTFDVSFLSIILTTWLAQSLTVTVSFQLTSFV